MMILMGVCSSQKTMKTFNLHILISSGNFRKIVLIWAICRKRIKRVAVVKWCNIEHDAIHLLRQTIVPQHKWKKGAKTTCFLQSFQDRRKKPPRKLKNWFLPAKKVNIDHKCQIRARWRTKLILKLWNKPFQSRIVRVAMLIIIVTRPWIILAQVKWSLKQRVSSNHRKENQMTKLMLKLLIIIKQIKLLRSKMFLERMRNDCAKCRNKEPKNSKILRISEPSSFVGKRN